MSIDFNDRPSCIRESERLAQMAYDGEYWEDGEDGSDGPFELSDTQRQRCATLAVFYMLRANLG